MKTNTTNNQQDSNASVKEGRGDEGFGAVGTALHSTRNLFSTGATKAKKYVNMIDDKIQEVNEAQALKKLAPMARSARGSVAGPIKLVLGLIILSFCIGFAAGAFYFYHMDVSYISLVTIIPFIICLYLIISGYRQSKRSDIYNRYKTAFANKPYASIHDLSETTGQTDYKTVKNLKSFQDEGLYPQGRFSQDNQYYVLSEGAVTVMETDLKQREVVERQETQERNLQENYPELYSICEKIDEAVATLDELKQHQTALQKPQLRNELDSMDTLLKQIGSFIESNPQELPNMSHFLDYFLPTVTKLLDIYCKLDNQKIQTKKIRESKSQIESSFKNINSALKNIYDDFYTGTAMDVHSDVVVLKQMIEHEGLAEPDFKL